MDEPPQPTPPPPPDPGAGELARVIEEARTGSGEALDLLGRVIAPLVARSVERQLGARARRWIEPEDVANGVVREVLEWVRHAREPLSPGRVRAWAEAVSSRRTVDRARAAQGFVGESAVPRRAGAEHGARVPGPDEQAMQAESTARLQAALDNLDPEDRRIFRLAFDERWTYDRIAAELSLSRDQVYRVVLRVKDRLRALVEEAEP